MKSTGQGDAVQVEKRRQIENAFTYHAPKGDQAERYTALREKGKELALLMVETCPVSRELSLALTNLEDSIMWANASIARNEALAPGHSE